MATSKNRSHAKPFTRVIETTSMSHEQGREHEQTTAGPSETRLREIRR